MKILITGSAGFIGGALCRMLLERGNEIVGLDNLNKYYDVKLKQARLDRLTCYGKFSFHKLDIADSNAISELFSHNEFELVVNFAAQAGVRYSIENPKAYIEANLVGFSNVIENCWQHRVRHFIYASSSSVYGASDKLPFSETDTVDRPVSLYAATKKANELIAHTYSHIHNMQTTGLRLFTVYGPWGRPDMAIFRFAQGILEGSPIPVYNQGEMLRDFTYIDDIVESVIRIIDKSPDVGLNDLSSSETPNYQIYNIGNSRPVSLTRFIGALENALGKKASLNLLPLQPGDVRATAADVSRFVADFDYRPKVTIEEGVHRFVEWYCNYYDINLAAR